MFEHPFSKRYCTPAMLNLFSPQTKYILWRELWISLAKAQKKLGLPITKQQIDELINHKDSIDFSAVAEYEKKLRHDVMAHIHAYGDKCPEAKKIIHLGATSCFVTDNGPCFIELSLERWLRDLGCQHLTTAPFHPASNGLAERFVRTAKEQLKEARGDEIYENLQKFLFDGDQSSGN